MAFLINLLFHNEFIEKTSWCLQHFLTMEFYRKICNKCYWSSIYNSERSFFKKALILSISFLSLMFFSFFYLPTDPANTNKSSYFLRAINYIADFKLSLKNIFDFISNRIILISLLHINFEKISVTSTDIIKLKSSYRI